MQWISAFQLVLSGMAMLGLWLAALALAASGGAEALQGSPAAATPLMLWAAALGLTGLLVAPSVVLALRRLTGRPAPQHPAWPRWLRPTLLILLLPLFLGGGLLVSRQEGIAWLALPPFHLLAIGLPVLWLGYLAVRRLRGLTPQRAWGALAAGLTLAPALSFIVEMLLIGLAVVGVIAWLVVNPELGNQFQILVQRLSLARDDPDTVLRIVAPYLLRGEVIFAMFTFWSVLVPLIEELFKPAALWLLAGRRLSAAQGFGLGALCGAGYALIESLLLASGGEAWSQVVSARLGTGVIHIAASALTGYGLALAWRRGDYLRLALAYLTAVSLHGLWNGLTMATVLKGAADTLPAESAARAGLGWLSAVGLIGPLGLVILAMTGLILIVWVNRSLQKRQAAAAGRIQPGG